MAIVAPSEESRRGDQRSADLVGGYDHALGWARPGLVSTKHLHGAAVPLPVDDRTFAPKDDEPAETSGARLEVGMKQNSQTRRGNRGFGVAGTLDHGLVRDLAVAAEEAGYATFWVNDVPGGEGLAGLQVAAKATSRIRLAVGVIPLDRQGPEQIVDRIVALELPTDRLLVGVGSGAANGGLDRVRRGVASLAGLTPARIAVGALGPNMCQLAGEVADAVLLNWLVPGYVPASAAWALEGAATAGRSQPEILGYVRTALDEGLAELETEANRYASFPAYAANFHRMGATALETTVHAADRAGIQAGLAPFLPLLDETIIRCIAADSTAAAYRRVLEAAGPNER